MTDILDRIGDMLRDADQARLGAMLTEVFTGGFNLGDEDIERVFNGESDPAWPWIPRCIENECAHHIERSNEEHDAFSVREFGRWGYWLSEQVRGNPGWKAIKALLCDEFETMHMSYQNRHNHYRWRAEYKLLAEYLNYCVQSIRADIIPCTFEGWLFDQENPDHVYA